MRTMRAGLHRRIGWLAAIAGVLTAGCPVDVGYRFPEPRPRASAKRSAAPVAPAAASPTPPASPSPRAAIDAARRDALLASLRAAFPAGRASRVTSLLGDASGALRSNAASIISNNGGAIISDNGGSLISDNGGGYVLAQAAPVLPGVQPPNVYFFFTARTDDLVYEVTARTEARGRFRSFGLAAWDALPPERRLEALVDEFSWDEVVNEHPFEEDPLKLAITYKLQKVSSKRVPFTDKIDSKEIFRLVPRADGVDSVPIGWELAFALDVPGPGGTAEQARFRATAGEGDIQVVQNSQGQPFSLPRNMALAGDGLSGAYTGAVKHGTEVETTITHVAGTGARTVLALVTRQDGTRRHAVTAEAARLRLVAELAADGTGTGRLEDLDGQPAGTVTWDADGVATLGFADGETATSPLF